MARGPLPSPGATPSAGLVLLAPERRRWDPRTMKTPSPSPPHLFPFRAISPWPSRETFVPFKTRQAREARGARRAVAAHVLWGRRQRTLRLLVKREAARAPPLQTEAASQGPAPHTRCGRTALLSVLILAQTSAPICVSCCLMSPCPWPARPLGGPPRTVTSEWRLDRCLEHLETCEHRLNANLECSE